MLHLKYIDSDQCVKNGHYFGNALEVQDDFCHKLLDVNANEFAKDEMVCRYLKEVCHVEFFWKGYLVRNTPVEGGWREKSVTSLAYEIQLTIMILYFYGKQKRSFVLTGLIPAWEDLTWIARNKELDITIYIKDNFEYVKMDLSNHYRDRIAAMQCETGHFEITWKDSYFSSWFQWIYGEELKLLEDICKGDFCE